MSQQRDTEHPLLDGALVVWQGADSIIDGLCFRCRSLELSVDKFTVQSSSRTVARRSLEKFRLTSSTATSQHGNFSDIRKRAQSGCRLCDLIAKSVQCPGTPVNSDPDVMSTLQHATCQVCWEVDGRKAMKPKGKRQLNLEENTVRGLTRRIRLRWDNSSIEDAYLVLVAQEKHLTTNSDAHRVWGSASLFLGREISNNGNIQARVKSWLDVCRQKHCVSCTAPRGKTKRKFADLLHHSYFGVIDVLNMQLTELPVDPVSGDPAPYVALSYVWGTTRTFTSTLKNINLLRMHGGLETKLAELPTVIRDAIDLVRRLGLQFLWIDALCIIQDSSKSWKLNAYSMDTIYGNAELTICAADGLDASTGLVAMQPSTTKSRPTAADCGMGLRLMITRPPETYIKASKWNTRAWTFQERILSRRCLIFIDSRVYFQCRATGMSEDIYADREGAGWSLDLVDAPLQMWKQITDRSFWVYMNVARLYSSRELTHLKDISAAFSGIANIMECTMSAPFASGLPTSHFDLSLLWQHTGPVSRRIPRGSDETRDFNGLQFPSWSWMGWTGSPTTYEHDMLEDCLDDPNEWLAMHTWVRWYIRDGRGDLRPLWTEREWKEDKSKDVKWRGYTPQRTSAGMMSTHHSQRETADRVIVPSPPPSMSTESSYESESTGDEFGSSDRRRRRNRSRSLVSYDYRSNDASDSESSYTEKARDLVRGLGPSSYPNLFLDLLAICRLVLYPVLLILGFLGLHRIAMILSRLSLSQTRTTPWIKRPSSPSVSEYTIYENTESRRSVRLMEFCSRVARQVVERAAAYLARFNERSDDQRRRAELEKRKLDLERRKIEFARVRAQEDYKRQTRRPERRERTLDDSSIIIIRDRKERNSRRRHSSRYADDDYSPERRRRTQSEWRSKRRSEYRQSHYTRDDYYDDYRGPQKTCRADAPVDFDRQFVPYEDVQPGDTEREPTFHIYSKDCPYRPVVAKYTRKLETPELPLMPILQFWTYHTWLNISVPSETENIGKGGSGLPSGLLRCHIADDSGDWCGSIVLDKQWIKSKTYANREFIAISEAKRFTQDECEAWTYYIPKERDQSEWDLFYVMLIERKDEQWERVGLGKVFKEAFMRTANWKEIMLG